MPGIKCAPMMFLVQRHTNGCPVSTRHAREGGHPGFFLDSRQKHAGMTPGDNGHLILWSCTKESVRFPCAGHPGDHEVLWTANQSQKQLDLEGGHLPEEVLP